MLNLIESFASIYSSCDGPRTDVATTADAVHSLLGTQRIGQAGKSCETVALITTRQMIEIISEHKQGRIENEEGKHGRLALLRSLICVPFGRLTSTSR
jgi:hypothetical protein